MPMERAMRPRLSDTLQRCRRHRSARYDRRPRRLGRRHTKGPRAGVQVLSLRRQHFPRSEQAENPPDRRVPVVWQVVAVRSAGAGAND